MAAIASTNVTVTVTPAGRDIFPGSPKLVVLASVVFGDGSLTYPTNGVPMPAIGNFGFKKAIQFAVVDPPINGFVYKYDRTNHKILIYTQGMTTGSTGTTTSGNGALAENSAGAETAVRLANSAADTTYDFGPLKEMAATIAPAAVTLQLLLVGE